MKETYILEKEGENGNLKRVNNYGPITYYLGRSNGFTVHRGEIYAIPFGKKKEVYKFNLGYEEWQKYA